MPYCVRCGRGPGPVDATGLCPVCAGHASQPAASGPAASGRTYEGPETVPLSWSPRPGDVVGAYEICELLGMGAMGTVHRVHHREWDADLAMKSPRPEVLRRAGGAEAFVAESTHWMDLGLHPHVVCCHFVRAVGAAPRVFAEYVDGGSLQQWVGDGRLYGGGPQQALARVLDVAIQTAWGLAHIHDQALVHQDVKPANVLLGPDGTAKVTDVGLARSTATDAGHAPIGGTPAYFSPEQADAIARARFRSGDSGWGGADEPALAAATDVWSWALCVLDMMSGTAEPARHGQAGTAVLDACAAQLLRGDDRLAPVPSEVLDVLRQCLQPADRRRVTMLQVADRLVAAVPAVTGSPYPRRRPGPVDLRADSLNNRALSELELGDREQAVRTWGEAVRLDPHNMDATFNLALDRWRHAEHTDADALDAVTEAARSTGGRAEARVVEALLHLERGDHRAAHAAVASVEGDDAAAGDLAYLRSHLAPAGWQGRRVLATMPGPGGRVAAVGFAADEQHVRSTTADATTRTVRVADAACVDVRHHDADEVQVAAFAAGAARMACTGTRRSVRVWDLSTGRRLFETPEHPGLVSAVAVSRSGTRVASLCWVSDGSSSRLGARHVMDDLLGPVLTRAEMRVWDVESGRLRTEFQRPSRGDGYGRMSASADLSVVLVSHHDTAEVWDAGTGERRAALVGHDAWVSAVALSADGSRAVTGAYDHTVRCWDVETGACVVLRGHRGAVTAVDVVPAAGLAVSGAADLTVRLWDLAGGRCLWTVACASEPTALAASPRGDRVVVGHADGSVTVLATGLDAAPPRVPYRLAHVVGTARLAETQTAFESALREADAALAAQRWVDAVDHLRRARSVPGYRDDPRARRCWRGLAERLPGRRLVGNRAVGPVEGHTDAVAHVAAAIGGSHEVTAIGLDALGAIAVSGSRDGTIRSWDADTGACLATWRDDGEVEGLSLSADCDVLLAAVARQGRLFDRGSGTSTPVFPGQTSVHAVALDADAATALSTQGWDGRVRLWQLASPAAGSADSSRCRHVLRPRLVGRRPTLDAVALSGDGRCAAAGGRDTLVHVWDTSTGVRVHSLRGHTDWVSSVALDQRGDVLVSGSHDHTLRIWDVSSGTCRHTVAAHEHWVTGVAVSTDGTIAVSGGYDGTVRLWDVATGRRLGVLEAPENRVETVAVSGDAFVVAAGHASGVVAVWQLDWDYPVGHASTEGRSGA